MQALLEQPILAEVVEALTDMQVTLVAQGVLVLLSFPCLHLFTQALQLEALQ
jgi:hypothetical protein